MNIVSLSRCNLVFDVHSKTILFVSNLINQNRTVSIVVYTCALEIDENYRGVERLSEPEQMKVNNLPKVVMKNDSSAES